jgi:hypothetical protein
MITDVEFDAATFTYAVGRDDEVSAAFNACRRYDECFDVDRASRGANPLR